MRTSIVIGYKLMKNALRASGANTKREGVELGRRTLVQLGLQQPAGRLRGKIHWEGDLEAMRANG